MVMRTTRPELSFVDLYWLPLGAGDHCVRINGRLYEAAVAARARRGRRDLYHSALEVAVAEDRFVIEMAPAWGNCVSERGVVGEGSVGHAWLGASRLFRYEVR